MRSIIRSIIQLDIKNIKKILKKTPIVVETPYIYKRLKPLSIFINAIYTIKNATKD